MAKRAPKDQKPYRPVASGITKGLVASVTSSKAEVPETADESASPEEVKVIEPERRPKRRSDIRPELHERQPRGLDEEPRATPRRRVPKPREEEPGEQSPVARSRRRRSAPERLSVEKRILLNPSEDVELERFAHMVAAEAGTKIKLSHIIRAALVCLRDAEAEILQEIAQIELVRPTNGDMVGLAEFESDIAYALSRALRRARGRG